jgi:hypothetical protein
MSNRVPALALAAALGATAAGAVEIGAVGAANLTTTGQPPGADVRQLRIAERVVLDERIVSNDNGLAQFLFLDQSTLTIGPNADVTLDRFVYDPDAGTGEMALSVARGALRLIGGRVSKQNDATIATPGAVVGLRGGMATVDVSDEGTRVVLLAGEYARITAGGETLTLSRPGASAVIDGAGGAAAPRYAGVIDAAVAANLLGALRSAGDGGFRAATRPDAPDSARAAGAPKGDTVSTTGELAANADTGDDQREIDRAEQAAQTALYSNPGNLGIENMGFVPVGSNGAVRGQLVWGDRADLDLRLVLPDGAGEVFFNEKRVTFNDGGATAVLDVDNKGDVIDFGSSGRVENIAVNGARVPPGVYVFVVDAFSLKGLPESRFQLTVSADGGATVTRIGDALRAPREQRALDIVKRD